MLAVSPYIAFKGKCREAIEFYRTALGGEVVFMQTYGESPMSGMGPAESIMHSSMRVGESTILMCDDPRPDQAFGNSNVSLALGLGDPEQANRIFDNLAQEGSVTMPIQKTYWAQAFGMVTDKFGVKWMVNCEGSR